VLIAIQVNEATKLLEEGVVKSADEIDKAMVNGGGAGFGPFQLARGIGYDKLARICDELAQKYGVNVFKPTATLKKGNI
jgi:3-hydroxyacyl-CoA dehydrogenase